MDEDLDLYGDLQDTKPAPAVKSRPPLIDSQKLDELKIELEKVRQENETLKRNMGTLFRTARAEIQRKDAKIEDLMEQLDRKNAVSAT